MMNRESCKRHFENYSSRADTSTALDDLEKELGKYNLSFEQVLAILTYNRECLEFSVLTSPSHDILIKCKKL